MFRRILLAFAVLAGLCLAPVHAADTTYTYDVLGRVTRVDYPNGSSTVYTYDAAGNRTAVSTSVLPTPPTARDDTQETAQDTPATYDPRMNDSGSPITIISTGAPSHGGVVITSGGISVTYTPAAGYFGTDAFYYTISNATGGQSTALDTVTIVQTFPLPTAGPFAQPAVANTAVTFDPRSAATGAGIFLTGTPFASHGTVVNNSGVTLTYTPAANYVGDDSFTYTVTDIHMQSQSNTVTMTVAVPDPPALECDRTLDNTHPPHQITFDCRADPSLVVTVITQPSEGHAVLNADSTITFIADSGQEGVFDFSYTVKNQFNLTKTGTVAVTVTGSGL